MAGPALEQAPDRKWSALVPGLLLGGLLTLTAFLASEGLKNWLNPGGPPPVSAVLCAVLFGVICRNVIGLFPRVEFESFVRGLQWITNNILRVGIALVGLKLSLNGLASTATMALPVVIACISVAVIVSVFVGRLFGLSKPMRLLLAAGTSVCGCTAICAMTPVVRARAVESGLAVTCVVVLGCTGMLLYPWLAHSTFGSATHAAAVFLGTSIHDTSQVMGASMIYAQQFNAADAVPIAGFTKLLRNLSLLILVPVFAMWTGNSDNPEAHAKRRQVLPGFLIAFILLAVFRTAGDTVVAGQGGDIATAWSQVVVPVGLMASDAFLVCGMAAIGLSVSLKELRGVGSKALFAALMVAASVCVTSLAVTVAMQRLI
jgi:uncharacterized integral membrane protein (TIGR00698 family)